MKTLASYFCHLRQEKELTLRDLSHRSGLSASSIWKIENGKTVSGSTLHTVTVKGLVYPPDSNQYKNLVALWAERHGLQLPKLRGVAQKEWAPQLAGRDLNALQNAMKDDEARSAIVALARHYAKR